MKSLSRVAVVSLLALVLTGCGGASWKIPSIGGVDPNARLSGTLIYEKTEKHPKYGSQEAAIADGSCNLSFSLNNYRASDQVRCGNFVINVQGRLDADGNILSLQLKTLGTIYDMKGNIASSTALEPRNGFWRATLKLKEA